MINVGIVGYGNLGRACEKTVRARKDMTLVAIFSHREVKSDFGTPVVDFSMIEQYKDKIDLMLLCGGSATALMSESNLVAKYFNTADSFDTHALMPRHFDEMDEIAKANGHISLIATGWDPGLFSVMRVLFDSILPVGETYTFWGKGVSQGHSEAIRKIEGVKYGVQYTVPKENAIREISEGKRPKLTTRDKHERVCYVVLDDGADAEKIKNTIVNMPNYFDEYDTTVNFISEDEFLANHTAMPHGGTVIRSGEANGKVINTEFKIKLQSNPDFTASVLVSYAAAAMRLRAEGKTGAVSVFDIPVSYLSDKCYAELVASML